LPLLLGHYNRRGQSGRVCAAVGLVVLLQSLSLGFENLSNKNLWFLILMALNLLLPIVCGFTVLKRGYFVAGNNKLTRWLMRFFVIALAVLSFPSFAMNAQFVSDTTLQKDAPVEFEADSISYDQQNSVVTATGHVYLNQNGTLLEADKLVYNQQDEHGVASGNVVLTRPDGVKLYASSADLSQAFNQAELNDVLLRFADGSTFKSDRALRTDGGNKSSFENVFFTPCTYCSTERPLWDISAGKVEHDYKEQEYRFYNAVFDVKGVPVFYWPYLSYPDFQVKRKTGFLSPSLTSSSELGVGVELPFFWNISDSQDLYLAPTIAAKHFPLVQGQYRGVYKQSKLTAQFSMTQDKNDDDEEGHIKVNYENDLTDKLRFTGQYYRVSNHTYFRRYPIDNVDDQEPWIKSFAKAEYFGNQSYGFFNIMR
jgi:LPS-assembly protein